MKLISMKNKPKKNTLRGMKEATEVAMDQPAYPWGLEVSLNKDSIDKLGIDVENISAGDDVFFFAKAKVSRVSFNENIDSMTGKKQADGDVSLQIEKMHWGKPD